MKDILTRLRRNAAVEAAAEPQAAPRDDAPGADPIVATLSSSPEPRAPEASLKPNEDGRFIGYIDHVDRSVITGWCCDSHDMGRSLAVEAVASNGKRIAVIAGLFRQDVRDGGYGSGNYGFEIDVAAMNLKDETLVVRFAENKLPISKAPFSINPQRSLLEGRLPPSYTDAMRMLAVEIQAKHADLEERTLAR